MKNCYRQMTDKQLAQAVTCGSRDEFDEIVRRYCRPLTMFAAGRTESLSDAEDIVQETFLRAYQNINSFDCKYSLKNWLFTIAYRLIVSGYRKKKPRRLSDEESGRLVADESKPQENQWLWDSAREMGDDAFTALWLRYKQSMSISEIALVMKKTKTAVRVLLHRSRIRLAKQIADHPEIAERSQWMPARKVILEGTK